MSTVSIIIPHYGDFPMEWVNRAVRSAEAQTYPATEVLKVYSVDAPLHEIRNLGAQQAVSKYLIFLDADDELDPGYVEAMLEAEGDIRRPSTLGVSEDGTEDNQATMIQRYPLITRNWIVIGAMCRREMFLDVGGFEDFQMLEDWGLWLKMYIRGAEITDVPDAIYRIHVRPNSRNSDPKLGAKVYNQITRRYRADFERVSGDHRQLRRL